MCPRTSAARTGAQKGARRPAWRGTLRVDSLRVAEGAESPGPYERIGSLRYTLARAAPPRPIAARQRQPAVHSITR